MDTVTNTKESRFNKFFGKFNRRGKRRKIYKVRRSSGERQVLTKREIHKLKKRKKRRITKSERYFRLIASVLGILIMLYGAQLIIKGFVEEHEGSSNESIQDLPAVLPEDKQTEPKYSSEDENIVLSDIDNSIPDDKMTAHTEVPKSKEKTEYVQPKTIQKDEARANTLTIPPPELSIVQAPEGTITTPNVYFAFDANKTVTFSHMLEGYDSKYSDFSTIKSKSYSNLPDGSYTFHLRAKDKLDKITEPIVRTFSIDTTPPDVEIVEGTDSTVAERNITFRFSADDDATFATYLQGYDKRFSGYTENTTKSYNNLPDGDYIFQVKAKDKYGNESITVVKRHFTVDTMAPGVKIIEAPNSIIGEKSVTFRFVANKKATFAYWLKGQDSGYSDFISNDSVTYNELSDGEYVFFVKAKDKLGNVDPAPAKSKFAIDTTPPNTSITERPKKQIKHSTVSFSFEADEETSFSYYLEGYDDKYSDYTSESSKTYHNLLDGSYTFHVRSKDRAGNVDKKGTSLSFTVKTKELIFTEYFEDEKSKVKAGDFKDRKIYWGLTKKRAKSGKRSLWCAKVGNDGQTYKKDMNAWYHISVDLSRFDKAELVFWYYLDTTNDITDLLYLKAVPQAKAKKVDDVKPIWYAPVRKDKRLRWVKQRVLLDSVCGQTAIIRFCFKSDDKFEDEGAYIDDISIIGKYQGNTILRKY